MANLSKEYVERALSGFVDPYSDTDLVSGETVRGIGVDGDRCSVDLVLGYPAEGCQDELAERIKQHLERDGAIAAAAVSVTWKVVAHRVQGELTPMQDVKNIIAVASAKGGVGKSTTAVNLALALHADGASVGVLDADIYGPSQPRMLGLSGRPDTRDGKTLEPMRAHGLQAMSIGFLVDEEQPMVWRGPMVTKALEQLLGDTNWDRLDYLVIDLPPGTGDIQLTLAQKVPVSGAVVCTTPQDIALLDAVKGLRMFEKVDVPVLGIVENMGVHLCSQCGHAEHIFGQGGGERTAAEHGVAFLGSLPLNAKIREQTDRGEPTVVADPQSEAAQLYRDVARRTAARLARQARNKSAQFPNIVIQNT